jgi:hypothetical protein
MGQPVVAAAFWARHNKPIWQALADPVGQPLRQNHEFLNRFFIQLFVFQENPHRNSAALLVIGRHWKEFFNFIQVQNYIGM